MDRQLIKVAKEMNVGMVALVDFLNTKGFDVENKPNAKITDDMYSALSGKFSDSKAEKEKADQLLIGNQRPQQKSYHQHHQQQYNDNLRTHQPSAPERFVNKESPSVDVIERPKIVLQQPKVVGRIDLNPQKPTPVIQNKQTAAPLPDQNPVTTVVNKEPEVAVKSIEKVKSEPEKTVSELPIQSVPTKPIKESENGNQQSLLSAEEQAESEVLKADAPQLRGLKIKGKIDVNRYSDKPVSNNGNGNNNGNFRRDNNNNGNNTGNNNGNNNNRRGGNMNAGGNTGTGDNTAKRDDAAEAERRRRTRKRAPMPGQTNNPGQGGNQGQNNTPPQTRIPSANSGNTTAPNNTGNTSRPGFHTQAYLKELKANPQPQRQGNNPGNGQQRPGGGGRPGGNSPQQQRPGNRPTDNKTGNKGPMTPQEISQQEIEAKIKETMARLNIGGKNKGQKLRRDKRERNREKESLRLAEADGAKLQVAEFISVSELASLMDVQPTQIITTCMGLGVFVSINQRLDAELIDIIASEFGHEVEFISAEEQVGAFEEEVPDAPEDLKPRAPIVTVMGHVDHGKTSLLDFIRKAKVMAGEAGGITQHIGAYEVKLDDGRSVTFLDTPGHEAFTAMRARGAKVTDVAVVIIASDDNIMPQTKEAISHAQAANVPIVFAINKIDKAGADPERIKNELAQMNMLVESWGGKYQSQDISAKAGTNVELLLEKILLESEVLDLKANPNKSASGTVIEASLDKGRGYVTKLLVQAGTLSIGDMIVAGEYAGKVKAMFNELGKKVLKSGPSTPVLVLGLAGAPQAGETFRVMKNESEAKEIATKRSQIVREQSARANKRLSLDEIGRRLALGTFKTLNLIVKGDVDGSVEALSDALIKLSVETIQVSVLHKAVGQITESDVLLASASDAIIIGFQVRPSVNAKKLSEREGVEIKTYSIIYEVIDEIKAAMEGMLEPTKEEQILGTVEVREVYKISKVGTIAGCQVTDGKITRNALVRIIRDGIVAFPIKEGAVGKLGSLKRFKDDMKEVKNGFECGLTIDNFNDFQVGDTIEAYEIIEVKQKLK